MHSSDVTIDTASARFTPITLKHPFTISGRIIDWFTLAEVTVTVTSRNGRMATGVGSTILSVPWSWPSTELLVEERDQSLRTLTAAFARRATGREHMDPIRLWRTLYDSLDQTVAQELSDTEVPRLAALLTLGAVDSAVHDAWARAVGRPAHLLYTAEHLDEDLRFLGHHALSGRFPSDFLTTPRSSVAIQHLVGATDPLTPDEAEPTELSLFDWLRNDRPRFLKVKTTALDPVDDARRVQAVSEVAKAAGIDVSLTVDPNEGYRTARDVARFMDALDERQLTVQFLEQPTPRGAAVAGLEALRGRVPLLLDEGFTHLSELPTALDRGWSGVVIKAGKGHTPALLAHSFARAAGLAVTVQDLTAVGRAFEHSARLVSIFNLSSPHLEYNSRQYAPHGNDALGRQHPSLVTVRNGEVELPSPRDGIY